LRFSIVATYGKLFVFVMRIVTPDDNQVVT